MALSLQDAIAACNGDDEIFIVGGAQIYAQALPLVDTLYLTEVHADINGDAHFPEFDATEWQEVDRESHHQESPQQLDYDFVTLRRVSE